MLLPDRPLSDGVVTLRAWEPGDAEWHAATVTTDVDIRRWTSERPEHIVPLAERPPLEP